jgi:membrane protein involved in colicin uptake
VRVSFDTQQDTYEDALAVLRRAYGRPGPVRKQVDATPEGHADADEVAESATDSAAAAKKASASKSTTRRAPATKKAATKKAPTKQAATKQAATKQAATKQSATKKAATKKAATKKTATRKASSVPVAKRPGRATPREVAATGTVTNVAPPGQSEAVRAWAREQGMQVSDRGRMPASVIAAYEKAHS